MISAILNQRNMLIKTVCYKKTLAAMTGNCDILQYYVRLVASLLIEIR